MTPIFPTTYFGSIAYFKELVKYSHVLIESKEHFPKQSYRNRCDIVTTDGILSLSCPVVRHSGSKTPTGDVKLSSEESWKRDHWRSIISGYNPSPYLEHYGSEIEELIFNQEENLLAYNTQITRKICEWLDLDVKIEMTEEFNPILENDYRTYLTKKNTFNTFETAPYIQVFPGEDRYNPALSILDALLCLGPMARNLLIERK